MNTPRPHFPRWLTGIAAALALVAFPVLAQTTPGTQAAVAQPDTQDKGAPVPAPSWAGPQGC